MGGDGTSASNVIISGLPDVGIPLVQRNITRPDMMPLSPVFASSQCKGT